MRVELDFEKTVEQNASAYFESSKKAKRKLQSLKQAQQTTRKKLEESIKKIPEKKEPEKKKKLQWFHAYRWFLSSNGFLVVAGRSAKSNEQLVKKHLEKQDFFLHADIAGGSATIIKAGNKKIPEQTFREAAQFAAVFSKAWKQGIAAVDVYAVEASQVSKSAPSGESLGAGAFMVYGKRKWFRKTALALAIGLTKELEIVAGPLDAVKAQTRNFVELQQGKQNVQKTSNQIISLLGRKQGKSPKLKPDEVIKALPPGSLEVKATD
jgi:predicted ribosome quality control (RQC) complex YloA/Tae2 family protein